jgi:microcystin-dependent protein
MSEPFIGQIQAFGFNFAPRGWATCDGQIISIAQNTALFSLLGTTYGGNGQTTFALPDLRGRVSLHQGSGPGLSSYVMGQSSGTENVTLISTQMPAHNHLVTANGTAGSKLEDVPSGNFLGPAEAYSTTTTGATLNPQSLGIAGGNQPHPNMQPYLTINWCIALQGIFPSRN